MVQPLFSVGADKLETERKDSYMLPKLMKGGTMNTSALKAFWQEEDGQDLIEYALLMAFIALAAVAVLTTIQTNVSKLWNSVSDALSDAVNAA
jgi:Flp pilus assembly pilin Flp